MDPSQDPSIISGDLPFRPASNQSTSDPDTLRGPVLIDPVQPSISIPHSNGDKEGREMTAEVDLVGPAKKRRSKKKPKSKRGKNKPTGFEEYYVDAPMTPEQYHEEKAIYDVSRPLMHRIEDALLRYQKNRRIESDRNHIFLKYLEYGGVDVGPKLFAGVDDRELREMDSEQILIARGQTSIKHENINLPIDFNDVVKGYLTSYFPYFFNPETEDMVKLATVTIRNFLSYLLYHDVCPEYKDNIDEAKRSCDIATKELWHNQQFTAKGPGDFNSASSTLFGGFLFDMYVEDGQWKNPKDKSARMTREVARKVVKFALAGAGSDTQAVRFQELANTNTLRAIQVEDIHGFEVTAIYPPQDDVRVFYQTYAPDLRPVGRLLGKAFYDPGKPRCDLSCDDILNLEKYNAQIPEFEFFLEENALRHCYLGMKVMTSVWELNCGFHYFEDISTTYCSIYTVLANDLMLGWKKPRVLTKGGGDAEEDADEEEDAEDEKETL